MKKNVSAQSYSFSASFSVWTACFLVFFTLTSLNVSPLFAQSLADKFGGFSRDSNQPIDIEADQLKVNDIKKNGSLQW
jgi:lipopolysaccharide export system protein LptA